MEIRSKPGQVVVVAVQYCAGALGASSRAATTGAAMRNIGTTAGQVRTRQVPPRSSARAAPTALISRFFMRQTTFLPRWKFPDRDARPEHAPAMTRGRARPEQPAAGVTAFILPD